MIYNIFYLKVSISIINLNFKTSAHETNVLIIQFNSKYTFKTVGNYISENCISFFFSLNVKKLL